MALPYFFTWSAWVQYVSGVESLSVGEEKPLKEFSGCSVRTLTLRLYSSLLRRHRLTVISQQNTETNQEDFSISLNHAVGFEEESMLKGEGVQNLY